MAKHVKTIGALAATGLLMTGAASGAAALAADATDSGAQAAEASQAVESQASYSGAVEVSNVQGEFAFTQDAVTSNEAIASTFCTAVASMCSTASSFVGGEDWSVLVNGEEVTASELDSDESSTTTVMGCACSANVAGGGAVANAEATGVAVADLLAAG